MNNSVIIGLALIAVVFSFLDCTVKSEGDEQFEDYAIPDIVPKRIGHLHKPRQFLAGEDTPCWRVAVNGEHLNRINHQPVKAAVDHWKKNRDLTILYRKGRSVASTAMIANVSEVLHRRSIEKPDNITKVVRRSAPTKQSVGPVTHVYPTMLVVMDYLSEREEDRSELGYEAILNRIKYALAFWNSVNIRLSRRIKMPFIQLRIGGIVIGNAALRKKYSEYWWEHPSLSYQAMSNQFRKYPSWRNKIPPDSYDFIVHMASQVKHTDLEREPQNVYDDVFEAYSEWRAPCGPYPQSVGDIMFWDDFNFIGVKSAINKLLHVFGARDIKQVQLTEKVGQLSNYYDKLFGVAESGKCAWDLVTPGLSYAWCMSEPKTYFPPGKRVRRMMPADILSRWWICRNHFFQGDVVKGDDCGQFVCTYNMFEFADRFVGPDVDGRSCQNNKVCINNKCVTKTWDDD